MTIRLKSRSPDWLSEAVCVLLRYRWAWISLPAITILIVIAVSFLLPREYTAEAIFERRVDAVVDSIGFVSDGSREVQPAVLAVRNEITSDAILDELRNISKDKEDADTPHEENLFDISKVTGDLSQQISVEVQNTGAGIERVYVSLATSDPRLGRSVVNLLVGNYVDRVRPRFDEHVYQTASYFKREVARRCQEIQRLEDAKIAFEIKNAQSLPPNSVININQLGLAKVGELKHAVDIRDGLAARVAELEQAVENTPPTDLIEIVEPNEEKIRLNSFLDKVVLGVSFQGMTGKHPDVMAVSQRADRIEKQIQSQPDVITRRRNMPNPKRAALEEELVNIKLEHGLFQGKCEKIYSQIKQLEAGIARMMPVHREYETIRQQIRKAGQDLAPFEKFLSRVRVLLASKEGHSPYDLVFIHPCGLTARVESFDLVWWLKWGMVVSFLFGISGVLIFHYLIDDRVSDGAGLAESLGLPLVGELSEVVTERQYRVSQRWRMILNPIKATSCGVVAVGMLWVGCVGFERFRMDRLMVGETVRVSDVDGMIDTSPLIDSEEPPFSYLPGE